MKICKVKTVIDMLFAYCGTIFAYMFVDIYLTRTLAFLDKFVEFLFLSKIK